MPFITRDLHVKSLPEANLWELTRELEYQHNASVITVPAGTVTDFASIPAALRWRFNVNGKCRRAAVLHDYLYGIEFATRECCDRIFYAAMLDCGVWWWNARVMYWGVRAFGWTRGRW